MPSKVRRSMINQRLCPHPSSQNLGGPQPMPSRAVSGYKVRQASDVDSPSADMFVERINRGVKRGRAWWYVDATSGREDVFVVCVQGRGLSSVGHARTRLFDHKKILHFPFLLSLLLSIVGISPQEGCQSFSFLRSSRNTSASISSSKATRCCNGKLVSVLLHGWVECRYQSWGESHLVVLFF